MQAAAVEVNQGTYTDPSRLTVAQWLDIWETEYLGNVKPNSARAYRAHIRNHIRPGLGAVRLKDLHPHMVQSFINGLSALSPATVRVIYSVLRLALDRAESSGYIPRNPALKCVLPKQERTEIHPLDDGQAAALLRAAAGARIEYLLPLALFTGMRLSELLGLTWDTVDMERGTITVDKQLVPRTLKAENMFATPKSGKPRTITPAASAFETLRRQKVKQAEQRLKAGPIWDNPYGLVFTAEDGGAITQPMAENEFAAIRTAAGLDGIRLHDLRHPNVKPKTKSFFFGETALRPTTKNSFVRLETGSFLHSCYCLL